MKGLKLDYPIQNTLYILGEGLFIFFSVLASSWILIGAEAFSFNIGLFLKILLITLICQTSLFFNDAYDLKVTYRLSEHGIRLLQALGGSAIILAGIYFLFPKAVIGKGIAMLSISIAIFSIAFCRFFYILVINQGLFNKKVILMGSGDLAQKIVSEVSSKKDCGYSLAVIVPEAGQDENLRLDSSRIKFLESYEGLCEMAKAMKIKKVIVALMEKRKGFPIKELLRCRVAGIEVVEGNSFYETLTGKLNVDNINPGWLIFSEGFIKTRMQRLIKRGVDLVLTVALLILAPSFCQKP